MPTDFTVIIFNNQFYAHSLWERFVFYIDTLKPTIHHKSKSSVCSPSGYCFSWAKQDVSETVSYIMLSKNSLKIKGRSFSCKPVQRSWNVNHVIISRGNNPKPYVHIQKSFTNNNCPKFSKCDDLCIPFFALDMCGQGFKYLMIFCFSYLAKGVHTRRY